MSIPKALTQGDGDPGSTVEWQTPEALFDAYDAEFGPFTLDPATALGYHTSDVILSRGGRIVTLDGVFQTVERSCDGKCAPSTCIAPDCVSRYDRCVWTDVDGLAYGWTGRVWLNHPYGRADWRWMKKAHDSVRFGDAEIVVALVPVKPQMKWWHKYVLSSSQLVRGRDKPYAADVHNESAGSLAVALASEAHYRRGEYGADIVRFVRGRLRFGGAPSSAPFASAIIVWRK